MTRVSTALGGFALGAVVVYIAMRGGGDHTPTANAAVVEKQVPHARTLEGAPMPMRTLQGAPGTTAPQPGEPPSMEQLEQRVGEEALAGLMAQPLDSECWDPAIARAADPATANYVYDLTFDAAGNEISRGINETRGESRADVGVCLSQHFASLRVHPPGQQVHVLVTVAFPF
jgi:hypothetical protein